MAKSNPGSNNVVAKYQFQPRGPSVRASNTANAECEARILFLHATRRKGLDNIAIEKRLHGADSPLLRWSRDSEPLNSRGDRSHRPRAVFLGGRMVTCAQTDGSAALRHGYKV